MVAPGKQREVVVVTGSTGLIGREVCLRFGDEGHRVVGLNRPGEPYPPSVADDVPFDLTNDATIRSALDHTRRTYGPRIASVIHLAAYYDFSGEPSPLYEEVTVRGTERLLRGLREGGFAVEQFLFSSTMLVHAPCQPGQKIDEDSPLEGKWDYPRSKIRTEQLIREQRGNIPAVMLRVAGVYDDEGHSIPLAHQIDRMFRQTIKSQVFPGDTSRGQAFVHLDDVTEAIWLTVQRRHELPDEVAILIGEPQTLSYEELQRSFARLIHGEEDRETKEIPKVVAKAGAWVQDKAAVLPMVDEPFIKPWMIDLADDHYELDITRARNLLGWEPRHSLRETLPQMVKSLKRDPAAWYREHELEFPGEAQDQQEETAGQAADRPFA